MDKSNKTASNFIACISVILLIVLDQITKIAAYRTLRVNGAKQLVEGVFELRYLENRGAAWGMFSGARVIFVVIAVVLTLAVVWFYVRAPYTKRFRLLRIAGVLLVSGAIGNMIDRIARGYVIDFLSFSLIHFPIFNVADCYVTVSAFGLAFLILFYYKDEEFSFLSRKSQSDTEAQDDMEAQDDTGLQDDTVKNEDVGDDSADRENTDRTGEIKE